MEDPLSAHVLAIGLGPVQEFIAQARRTRDLWYGSHLLSEVSKAAAKALVEIDGVELVFPALQRDSPHLEPSEQPRTNGDPVYNVSNRLLAVLAAGCDPSGAAAAARAAAQERLEGAAEKVRSGDRARGLIHPHATASWNEQIKSLLDFAAAWSPMGSYESARDGAEGRLAGRKSLREFRQWVHQRPGVPKSSLDGARESVLVESTEGGDAGQKARQRLRLSPGEQLDAVGLLKRAGGDPEQFPPIANIAMAAWIELAASRRPEQLGLLRKACKGIEDFPEIRRDDLSWVGTFPFDAHVFREERWEMLQEEYGPPFDGPWAEAHVRSVLEKMPSPPSYVACIVADGDHMGLAIDSCETPPEHQALSRELAKFTAEARRVVEGKSVRGVLVYSGGDDVIAFVCLEDAVACAEALRRAFKECMEKALPHVKEPPTLSVGVGVGHLMDEMGHLLTLGRSAEKLAKTKRNALAVIVDKRAGETVSWLSDWEEDPAARLHRDVALVREKRLSRGKVFEVRDVLRRLPREGGPEWSPVLAHDTRRTLARTQAGGEAVSPEEVGLTLDAERPYGDLRKEIDRFVNRMLVAWAVAEPGEGRA